VVRSGWRTDGLGYAVVIDHHNGYVTIYGHQVRHPPVKVGQYVTRGQVIGYVGSTGRSTGPHVHFIIRTPGRHYYNPLKLLGR
jgi:murein DD-endopeptidase MepM/ murein hydrolase activator NlpD